MQFGMNLLLWTDHLHDGLMPVLEQLSKSGTTASRSPFLSR